MEAQTNQNITKMLATILNKLDILEKRVYDIAVQ